MISFIKLLNEEITLSQEEKNTFKEAYRQMGLDEEWAEYDFAELLKWLEELPQTIILYRLLYLHEGDKINKEELGDHYSENKKALLDNHHHKGSIYSEAGDNAVLLTVEIDKEQIDIFNTLYNNILYPHEEEITLKNKGKGTTLIDIKEI